MNLYTYSFLFATIFSLSCWAMNTSMYFYQDEIQSLSELPLEKLIKIKSSFTRNNIDDYKLEPEFRSLSKSKIPLAMPLKRNGNSMIPMRRHEEWDDKGKDSKISKIFQLTITTLSFLAFGGYLLTLIITSIKRNQQMSNPGVIVVSSLNNLPKIKRPKRGLVVFDPEENEYDTGMLYKGMIMLSNDYSNHYY